jgi:SAM-dependent methyltransferase
MADVINSCCTPAAQATCCEPADKAACCGEHHTDGCGCAGGRHGPAVASSAGAEDLRETVRDKYAAAARAAARGQFAHARALESGSGCGDPDLRCCSPADPTGVFGARLYDAARAEQLPDTAVQASLGCGVPTAVADLHEGETVLDLGSGAGADVLISARRVGPSGKAIGVDMTHEMLELARRNAADAGVENAEFLEGYLEQLPLPDASVDVVISNCVINLSGDKPRVLREAARVLKPGGRFAVSDVIADPDMDAATKADMRAWTGCIAGALTEREFRAALDAAGFVQPEFRETHRVHEHAAAAIIRAGKPVSPGARGV